jgi:hypothetical protein
VIARLLRRLFGARPEYESAYAAQQRRRENESIFAAEWLAREVKDGNQ